MRSSSFGSRTLAAMASILGVGLTRPQALEVRESYRDVFGRPHTPFDAVSIPNRGRSSQRVFPAKKTLADHEAIGKAQMKRARKAAKFHRDLNHSINMKHPLARWNAEL